MLLIRAQAPPGTPSIQDACSEAIALAKSTGAMVAFDFNGVDVVAAPHSRRDDLVAEWIRLMEIPIRAAARRQPPQTIGLILIPPGMQHWDLDIRNMVDHISNPKRTETLVLELRQATTSESRSEGA